MSSVKLLAHAWWEKHRNECYSLTDAYEAGFRHGMDHTHIDRNKVSVHGSDECMNCDDGRITIYAGSRYCVACQHRIAHAEKVVANEKQ